MRFLDNHNKGEEPKLPDGYYVLFRYEPRLEVRIDRTAYRNCFSERWAIVASTEPITAEFAGECCRKVLGFGAQNMHVGRHQTRRAKAQVVIQNSAKQALSPYYTEAWDWWLRHTPDVELHVFEVYDSIDSGD